MFFAYCFSVLSLSVPLSLPLLSTETVTFASTVVVYLLVCECMWICLSL